jgi:hypothetical protein
LIAHEFNGSESEFAFNLREQINTDVYYDEVQVNYIQYNALNASYVINKIYVPEFQQYLGSFYKENILMNMNLKINLEKKLLPQSITLKLMNIDNSAYVPPQFDDIAIMLTFIKH